MKSRWPVGIAICAILSTVLCIIFFNKLTQLQDWTFYLLIVAILIRQTERYVIPGGYRKWFEKEVHHKYAANKATKYMYAGLAGLIFCAAIGSMFPHISLVAVFYVIFDSVLTLFLSIKKKHILPGIFSTVFFVLPLSYLTISRMVASGAANLVSILVATTIACIVFKYFFSHLSK